MDPRFLATIVSNGDVGQLYKQLDPRSCVDKQGAFCIDDVNSRAQSLRGALELPQEANLASINLESMIDAYKKKIEEHFSLLVAPPISSTIACAKTYLDKLLSVDTIRCYLSEPTEETISQHATKLTDESVSIIVRISIALLELPKRNAEPKEIIETKLINLDKLLRPYLVNHPDKDEYTQFVNCIRRYDGPFQKFIENTGGIPGLPYKERRETAYVNYYEEFHKKMMPKPRKRKLQQDEEAADEPAQKKSTAAASDPKLQDQQTAEIARLKDENRQLRMEIQAITQSNTTMSKILKERQLDLDELRRRTLLLEDGLQDAYKDNEGLTGQITKLEQQLEREKLTASQHYRNLQDANAQWTDHMLRAEQLALTTSSLKHTIGDRDQHIQALKSQIAKAESDLAASQRRVSELESELIRSQDYASRLQTYSETVYRQVIMSGASSIVRRDHSQEDPRLAAMHAASTSRPVLRQESVSASSHPAHEVIEHGLENGSRHHRASIFHNGRLEGGPANAAVHRVLGQGPQSNRTRPSIFNNGRLVGGHADAAEQDSAHRETGQTRPS